MLEIDQSVFYLFNLVLSCRFFDLIMPVITELSFWFPLFIPLYLCLAFSTVRADRSLALLLIFSIGLTDQMSSAVLKKVFKRDRPCCVEPMVRKLLPCKGSKSFPSSHAANTGSLAGVFLGIKGWSSGISLFLIACVISFTRVYVGVHYPLDILAGLLFGFLFGGAIAWFARRRFPRLQQ